MAATSFYRRNSRKPSFPIGMGFADLAGTAKGAALIQITAKEEMIVRKRESLSQIKLSESQREKLKEEMAAFYLEVGGGGGAGDDRTDSIIGVV